MKTTEVCPREKECAKNGTAAKARKPVSEVCNPKGCKLYFTHPNSTPPEFQLFLYAAMQMREARIFELRESFKAFETESPFWKVWAYKAFERAYNIAENEKFEKDGKDKPNRMEVTAANTPKDDPFYNSIVAIEARSQSTSEGGKIEKLDPETAQELDKFFRNPV